MFGECILLLFSVSFDRSTQLSCRQNALAADLIIFVEGHVKRKEACVRLGEALAVHLREQRNLVPLAIAKIDWQPISAPDKLEVQGALSRRE